MTSSFSSKLHSTLFTFLIGQNEAPVIVHSGVVAALSPPLECLIREAHEKIARFPALETSISEKTSEHEYSRLISSFISGSYGGLELVFDEYLRLDRAANGWVTEEESHDDTPGFSQAWREDVANILLGHAHIYVFASKYMILKLQYLSLHKMHTFLADLRIFPLTRGPVIELIRYIYNNENISDRGEEEIGVDLLRNLVIRFVSLHRKEFKWFPGHRAALKQNSEYALDFLDYTEHMLLEIESIVDELKDNGEGELEQKDGEEDLSY